MQRKSEGAMKTSSSRASKWAPTWYVCMTTSKSLSGQPNPDLIQRLAIKGFWDSHTDISSGGSFRSSWWARFHGTLRFALHFFYHPTLSIWAMWNALALSIIDHKTLARDQKMCPDVRNMSKRSNTVQSLEFSPGVKLLCDMDGPKARPLVPKQSRDLIIRMYHQLSHPGQKETLDKVKASYFWSTMGKDVSRYVRGCQTCQAVKPYKEIRPPMSKIRVPDTRFSELQINVVGPMPQSENMKYLLTIIDRTTRWIEAVPMPEATSAQCGTPLWQTH